MDTKMSKTDHRYHGTNITAEETNVGAHNVVLVGAE